MSTQPAGRVRRSAMGHKPKKTAMLLAQRIVGEIVGRGLEPGSPLLSEREMLEEYGVARGTLREALRFLEIQGVISIRTGPGGGPVVNTPGFSHLASVIAMMLQLENAPFRAVLEARGTLEPWMARRAAERASGEEIAELRASVQRMKDGLDDIDAFLDENERFHADIARASGNKVIEMFLGSLNWIVDGTVLGVDYPDASRQSVVGFHSRIADAIEARDGIAAAQEMEKHMQSYADYLEARYPQVLDTPIRWDALP